MLFNLGQNFQTRAGSFSDPDIENWRAETP